MTTPRPRRPGWHRFQGVRSIRVGQTAHLDTIVYAVYLPHKRELAIQLIGRSGYFRLDSFTGEFEYIELERIAA